MTVDVHPAAAVFPMLTDGELADLAADIKANGLLHPIVLDEEGRIVDGRNRYAACQLADVEPTFERLNGHDAVTLILSANMQRRQMTKGQLAMVWVRMRAVIDSITESALDGAPLLNISQARIGHALIIHQWAPDLVDGVISGSAQFDAAYQTARERRAAASSAEAQLRRLKTAAPDLATRVVEEQMDLAEAIGALRVRQQREADAKRATSHLADSMLAFLDPGSAATIEERAAQIASTLDRDSLSTRPDFSAGRFDRCGRVVAALAGLLADQEVSRGDDTVPLE